MASNFLSHSTQSHIPSRIPCIFPHSGIHNSYFPVAACLVAFRHTFKTAARINNYPQLRLVFVLKKWHSTLCCIYPIKYCNYTKDHVMFLMSRLAQLLRGNMSESLFILLNGTRAHFTKYRSLSLTWRQSLQMLERHLLLFQGAPQFKGRWCLDDFEKCARISQSLHTLGIFSVF